LTIKRKGRERERETNSEVSTVTTERKIKKIVSFPTGEREKGQEKDVRVSSGHHILGIEHLLGELRDGDRSVLLRSTSGEGSEPDHEEVQTREGDHVDGELPQVRVELSRELHSPHKTSPAISPSTLHRACIRYEEGKRWVLTRKQVVIPDMTTETRWLRSP
jgi:hypothetical protein